MIHLFPQYRLLTPAVPFTLRFWASRSTVYYTSRSTVYYTRVFWARCWFFASLLSPNATFGTKNRAPKGLYKGLERSRVFRGDRLRRHPFFAFLR